MNKYEFMKLKRISFLIFFTCIIISFGFFNIELKADKNSYVPAQVYQFAGENINSRDNLETTAMYGPYYYEWIYTPLPESATGSWNPYRWTGSYTYSWSGSYFSFIEPGTDQQRGVDTGIYQTCEIRSDTIDISNPIFEFDIRFRTWLEGGYGGFEDSYLDWYTGYSEGYDFGYSNIDDVVENGMLGSFSHTVSYVEIDDATRTNIQYDESKITLYPGLTYTFSIATWGYIEEEKMWPYPFVERCECYIFNVQLFMTCQRSLYLSDIAANRGETISVSGDGYMGGAEITAVWLGANRISSEYLVGDTIIQSNGEISNSFGFKVPSNIIGTYDNISIETDYQTTTYNSDGGFPGFTVLPGIKINENDDFKLFTTQGNGLSINPYILENLNLDLHGVGLYGIWIDGTNANFVIRDSVISNAGISGIHLSNVINGKLVNNKIHNCNGDGIQLRNSYLVKIMDNTIHENGDAGIVLLDNAQHNTIQNNNISYNLGNGLEMNRGDSGSNDNNINENLLEFNKLWGISTTGSSNIFYRNFVWLNDGGQILDGGISEIWIENLVDPNGDFDNDKLLNREEVYLGTDPFDKHKHDDDDNDDQGFDNSGLTSLTLTAKMGILVPLITLLVLIPVVIVYKRKKN